MTRTIVVESKHSIVMLHQTRRVASRLKTRFTVQFHDNVTRRVSHALSTLDAYVALLG
jgi:hypothetical protein